MPCIYPREGDGVVIIYDLDECGAPDVGAGNKLVLDSVSEVAWEEQIDEGDQVTERNFGGRKCYSDQGQDEINHVQFGLTLCGLNPAVDGFLMGSRLKTRENQVVGFGRTDLTSGSTNVAIEVLLKLDADACTDSGAAPVAGWFFPLVQNWRPNGGTTLNGSDLVKPAYQGKGQKNTNVFTDTPYDLERWESVLEETDEWYGFYIFDGDDIELPEASCEPTTFAAVS